MHGDLNDKNRSDVYRSNDSVSPESQIQHLIKPIASKISTYLEYTKRILRPILDTYKQITKNIDCVHVLKTQDWSKLKSH